MGIEIKKRVLYDFDINGKPFTGFKVISEWEGFKKLEDEKGNTVITMSDDNDILSGVLKAFTGKDPEMKIIKASSYIVSAMDSKKE